MQRALCGIIAPFALWPERTNGACMVAWVDQVPVLPTIGILHSQQWLGFGDGMMSFVDRVAARWGGELKWQRAELALSVESTTNGLALTVDPQNVILAQRFHVEIVRIPGSTPRVEVPDLPPVHNSLKALAEEVVHCAADMKHARTVQRVGVFLEAHLDARSLPPGVEGFRERLGRAIGRERLRQTECSMLADVRMGDDSRDQCHHRLSFDDDNRPNDLRFTLDYQRLWTTAHATSDGWLRTAVMRVQEDALRYAEGFGVGEWLDEQ